MVNRLGIKITKYLMSQYRSSSNIFFKIHIDQK